MRLSRAIMLILVVATILVIVPQRAVPSGSNELTMAVWGMPFEDLLFRDMYARGFEDRHSGWTISYQRFPSAGLIPKYKAWHFAGRGADILRLPITNYHAIVELGAIEPLDQFIHDPEIGLSEADQRDFFPYVYNLLNVNGLMYALPSDNSQFGLYYNRDLFNQWNAAHPDDRIEYPDESWTWDDLRRVSEKLTIRDPQNDNRISQHGVSFDLWAWPYLAFLKQAGGEIWDENKTTVLIDSAEGVEAMEFMASLIPADAPIRSLETAEPPLGPAQLFKQGRLAVLLDGCWWVPNIDMQAPELDYAISPLPMHRKRAIVSGSVLWAISSHSQHKEMAWEMIKWMTSFEGSMMYWNALRVAPPARVSVLQSPNFRKTTGLSDVEGRLWVPPLTIDEFPQKAEWLLFAITPDPKTSAAPGFVPVGPYEADLESQIARAMVQVVRGEKPANVALRDAVRATHAIIDRDRQAKGLAAIHRQQ